MKLNESKFKIISDSKDEPTLEQAQEFVGGYVECFYHFIPFCYSGILQ